MMEDLNNAPKHQHIFHNGESYIKLADAADTFKRLSPWRTAIYDAPTEWHDPPRDSETPKDALRRLIQHEIIAALDPSVSQSAADLVATARREGVEDAATRLEELHKNHKYNRKTGEGSEHDVGYYRAIAEGVAHILRAAAKDRQP